MGLEALPARAGFLRHQTSVAHTCACMQAQTHMHAHKHTYAQTHMCTCTYTPCSFHMCVHAYTYMCMYATRGAGQLPALRAALSPQISAAKVLAYGETSCCRDGKPSKQAEESYAEGRVPAGRDHVRRSVIVEVSPRPRPGHRVRARLPGTSLVSFSRASGPWGPRTSEGAPRQKAAASGPSLWRRAGCGESAWIL